MVLILIPFLVAMRLDPNPSGLGTHRQLGLPPCTALVLWDIRCPMCGMTTAWAHLVRGRVFDAMRCNLGGVAVAALAVAFLRPAMKMVMKGRWPTTRDWRSYSWLAVSASVVVLANWVIQLSVGRT